MNPTDLSALVMRLLVAAHMLSGYPMPANPPEVELKPHAWLEKQACTTPCPVYGWYARTGTIYLDDGLDIQTDVFARSVLVHELVHFLQGQTDRAGAKLDCSVQDLREREAYHIQYRWLARQAAPPEAYMKLGLPPPPGLCAQ